MSFTKEQIEKAKETKSAEELFTMAKAGGVPMTEDEAKKYFDALHAEGELSDTELCAVAGGGKNDPQEYHVDANWAPSCGWRYAYACGRLDNSFADTCGRCTHFHWEGNLTPYVSGVCRREFED